MIHWEDAGCNHVYTIGTRAEIMNELLERLQGVMQDIKRAKKDNAEVWQDYIYDAHDLTSLMTDIDQNAETGKLIALTPDTPTGELGWYYVNDIDIDLHW